MYEAANHKLIGAIRELAEQHSIAAPDGQLEVDTLHVDALYTHTKHTLTAYTHITNFVHRHMVHVIIDRLTEGILIHTIHMCINRL